MKEGLGVNNGNTLSFIGFDGAGRAVGTMTGYPRYVVGTHPGRYDGAVGPGGGGGGNASSNSGSCPPTPHTQKANSVHATSATLPLIRPHDGLTPRLIVRVTPDASGDAPSRIRPIAIPRHTRDDPLTGSPLG